MSGTYPLDRVALPRSRSMLGTMIASDAGARCPPVPRAAAALIMAGGMWAVVAQTLLFRAFFETFEGSEFGIAAFFATWLMWVAIGAATGRVMVRRWQSWRTVATAALAQGLAATLQVLWTMQARQLANVQAHDLFPIVRLLPLAWLINAPVSFVTGLTFTAACGAAGPAAGRSVARVYRLDALGAALGGLGGTLALAAGWTDERLAMAAFGLLAAAAAVAMGGGWRQVAAATIALAAALAIVFQFDERLTDLRDRFAWSQLLPVSAFRGRFTTGQATYRFGEREGAWVVQSRETIVETVGAGDHAATVAAVYLACVPTAQRILVAGPDTYSLALAWLSVPGVARVVWVPPDPGFAREWPARLPISLQPDPTRFVALDRDLRSWLATTAETFDIIAIEAGPPLTLADHRLLTVEFLELARRRLAEGGVVGLRFPGGAAYLGPELSQFGAALAATAEQVFRHVTLQPGDESRWLMTDRNSGFASPLRLARMYASIQGIERLAPPDVVTAAFSIERAESQLARYAEWRRQMGDDALRLTDSRPASLIPVLALALRQAGHPRAAAWWNASVRPAAWSFIAAALGAAIVCLGSRRRGYDVAAPVPLGEAALMIVAAGAVGMTGSLALMLAWQTHYGSLYLHVGALSALYMMGVSAGAAASERIWSRCEPMRRRWPLWSAVLLHSLTLTVLGSSAGRLPRPAFAMIALLGALGGAYIPFVARRLAARAPELTTGASIELFDHLGGTLGALATGLIVIPALGLGDWTWWAVALLTCVLPASFVSPRLCRPVDDRADVVVRRIGLATGWLVWVAAVFTVASRATRGGDADDMLAMAARRLLPGRELHAREWTTADGRRIHGYVAGNRDAPEAWCFSTTQIAPGVVGYGGPIELAVALDREGVLLGVRVLRSRETPQYFDRLQHWFDALRGWRVADPAAPVPVDTVSGATTSSRAVLDALREAAPRFAAAARLREADEVAPARNRGIARETVMLAVLGLGALVLRGAPAHRLTRTLALAVVAAVLGCWLNIQISVAHLRVWFEWPWPPVGWNLAWILPVAVPLSVALVGNVYCGWLCPFGAVQELAAALRPRHWPMPPKIAWRWARWIKYSLLACGVGIFLAAPHARIEDLDPLTLAFASDVPRKMGITVLALIAISVFVPRFWCRVMCPTGAWLSLVAVLRPFERWWPRIQPRACDLGVRGRTDLDCITCDRCRQDVAVKVRALPTAAWHTALAGLVAVGLTILATAVTNRRTTWAAPTPHLAVEASASEQQGGTVLGLEAIQRIRERQRAGRLATREAMYYSRLDRAPETESSTVPRRTQWRGGRGSSEEPDE